MAEQQQQEKKGLPTSLSWDKQVPIKDLELKDILLWRNVYVSLFLFLSVQAIHLLLTRYNFTVVTLVGRILLVQVIVFFLYIVGARIMKNTNETKELPFGEFEVTPEMLKPFVEVCVAKINAAVAFYVNILLCRNLANTIKFAVIVQCACMIGKLFSGITLLYISLNAAFIAPIVYEYKKKEIDQLLALVQEQAQQLLKQIAEKIPKSVTAVVQPKAKDE